MALCCFGRRRSNESSVPPLPDVQETFENSLKNLSRKVCDVIFRLTQENPLQFSELDPFYNDLHESWRIFDDVVKQGLLPKKQYSDRVVPISGSASGSLIRRNNPELPGIITRIENCNLFKSSAQIRCNFGKNLDLEEQIKRVAEVASNVLSTVKSKLVYAQMQKAVVDFAESPFCLPPLGRWYLENILHGKNEPKIERRLYPEEGVVNLVSSVTHVKRGEFEFAEKAVASQEFLSLHEAVVLSCLRHPNIVSFGVVTAFEENKFSFVMQLASQQDLFTLEENGTNFSYDKIIRYFKGYATALAYLHDKRVVHGDVKPPNLLVHDNEGLLADFEDTQKEEGRLLGGTFAYLSPESAFEDKAYAASDMWSLGVSLFVLLFEEDLCEFDTSEDTMPIEGKSIARERYKEIQRKKGGFEQYLLAKMQEVLRDPRIFQRVEKLDPNGKLRGYIRRLVVYDKSKRMSASDLCLELQQLSLDPLPAD